MLTKKIIMNWEEAIYSVSSSGCTVILLAPVVIVIFHWATAEVVNTE